MNEEYKVGDKLWIHMGGAGNTLIETEVLMVVDVPGHGINYIVTFFNSIDWQLELRSWISVSETAEGPINMWRRARMGVKKPEPVVLRCPNWPEGKTDCGLHNLQCGYPDCLE